MPFELTEFCETWYRHHGTKGDPTYFSSINMAAASTCGEEGAVLARH
jgi:hypothetical protein